jgi:predicted alpha/beta-fold hydrolase
MNDSWRCYHSGETGDLDHVFRLLHSREPATPIGVVGFSLGGNVVLKWLGEQGGAINVMGAVAVSVPMVLEVCATRMDQGLSRWYRNRLVRELKHYLSVKRSHLRAIGRVADAARIEALGDLRTVRSFWEYDDLVVAGLYAFDGVQDYYARSSSRQYLQSISVPTLVIQAVDDPFMTPDVIPEVSELSDQVRIEVCRGGGHVGFIGGANPGHPQYWLEHRIPDFLAECKNRPAPGHRG